MRIGAPLDDRVDGSLYISEEKIGMQRISMEMLDFRGVQAFLVGSGGR